MNRRRLKRTVEEFRTASMENLIVASFIFIEFWAEGSPALFSKSGLPFKVLPQWNRTAGSGSNYLKVFDGPVVAAIARRFAVDFRCFGFFTDVSRTFPDTVDK